MSAILIVIPLLAWFVQPGYVRPVKYYHIASDICDVARSRFYEDWLFSWRSFECGDIYTMIRHAFDAWQYNSDTVFYETRNMSGADVVIGTETLNERKWIALTQRYASTDRQGEIHFSLDMCWYTDRHFCYSVNHNWLLLCICLITTWSFFLCLAIYNLYRRPQPLVSIPRLIVWVIVLSIPTLMIGSVIPCMTCHDFTAVVIHEVGHILGFGHSDETSQMCGCGGEAMACSTSVDTGSLMHSISIRRNTLCLSRDDVDGVRSIYGGVCDDPIWCYETPSTSGYTRVSTTFLYSFIVSSSVVFMRNRFIALRLPTTGTMSLPDEISLPRRPPPKKHNRGPINRI
jgi:hypothetical protein